MLHDVRYRLHALFRRKTVERELEEELHFHMEREVEKNMRAGMTPQEAKRQARLAFGGEDHVKEDCREARGTRFVDQAIEDAKFAVRQLRANPTFSLVIMLTLTLSIGANSAIFSVIHGVLLKRLPYPQPERIARIVLTSTDTPQFPLNPFDFLDFRARNRSFAEMAAYKRADMQLAGAGEPIHLNGFAVTSGFFRVLGIVPQLGREFDVAAEKPGNGLQLILSDRVWRRQLHADPNVIGRTMRLNAQPFTIVGIMPPGTEHPGNGYHAVAYGENVDVWWPFTFEGDPNNRGSHFIEGIGRLKAGVSIAQANAEMNAIMARLGQEHPDGDAGWNVRVISLYSSIVGASRQMLLVLLGAVGMVLLIACANTANLLLARASARQREIAVRLAMGAPRGRIVRQLLTESLLIALVGGTFGLALAFTGVRAMVALLPANFPRAHDIHISWPVFAFTLLISLLTGLLFGLAPAMQASYTDPKQGIQQGARGSTASRHQNRLRSALVIAEVSMACILLIAAGLMLRTFLNLVHLDPGFREDHLLTASIALPRARYKTNEQTQQFYEKLISGLNALPGVVSAGAGSDLPWTGYDENSSFNIEGKKPAPHEDFGGRYHMAMPGYFTAMGIPLLAGRSFTDADKQGARKVIIINHAMAERYWPGENVLGKRITFEDTPKTDADWLTITGVVGDVKDQPNKDAAEPAFWWPAAQRPQLDMSLALRTVSDPRQAVEGMSAAVHRLDPEVAVADVKLMDQVADASLATPRFLLVLVGLFAAVAILLAGIGAYGVVGYTVTQRTPEFGLRLALGAQRTDLLRMVLTQSALLAIPGTILGLVVSLALRRVVQSLLYGVTAADPVTFAAVALLVLTAALLASYAPARRAAMADPMTTLRAE